MALDTQGDRVLGVRSQASRHLAAKLVLAWILPAGTLLDSRAVESSGRDDLSLLPRVLR